METTLRSAPGTAEEVLRDVQALSPTLLERAAEVESVRGLPPDLLVELVRSGCFRMLLPTAYGGLGATLPANLDVVECLSRADPSVGWLVMIGSTAWVDLAGLPSSSFAGLYAKGPDVLVAGAFSPSGVAVPRPGGYEVSGRWGFVSGCRHADWLYGNCVERTESGQRLRIAVFRPEEVVLEDTWHVLGLRGTGSHHVRVESRSVPADRTWAILEDPVPLDAPVVRISTPSLFALQIAAVAVGTAQGALDEVLGVASTKVPLLAPATLATSPTFHREIAGADTGLRAARALLHAAAEEAWTTADSGRELTLEQRARMRAAAAWTVTQAADVVTAAYRAGGGSAVYLDSPLQRRLRDINTVTQHFLVRADTLSTAGAVLSGQDITVPVF